MGKSKKGKKEKKRGLTADLEITGIVSPKAKRKHLNSDSSDIIPEAFNLGDVGDLLSPKTERKRLDSVLSDVMPEDFTLDEDEDGAILENSTFQFEEEDNDYIMSADEERQWTRADRLDLVAMVKSNTARSDARVAHLLISWNKIHMPGRTREDLRAQWNNIYGLSKKRTPSQIISDVIDVVDNYELYAPKESSMVATAFSVFSCEQRSVLLESDSERSESELKRIVDEQWHDLSDEKKADYKSQAEDKLHAASLYNKKRLQPVDRYMSDKLDKEKAKYPELKSTDLINQLRKRYGMLSDSKKVKYIRRALEDDRQYKTQYIDFCSQSGTVALKLKPLLGVKEQLLYDKSRGLPVKPPINAMWLFHQERLAEDASLTRPALVALWGALPSTEKSALAERNLEMRSTYTQKFLAFLERLHLHEREFISKLYNFKPTRESGGGSKRRRQATSTITDTEVQERLAKQIMIKDKAVLTMYAYLELQHIIASRPGKLLNKIDKDAVVRNAKLKFSTLTAEEKHPSEKMARERAVIMKASPKHCTYNSYSLFFKKERLEGNNPTDISIKWKSIQAKEKHAYAEAAAKDTARASEKFQQFLAGLQPKELKLVVIGLPREEAKRWAKYSNVLDSDDDDDDFTSTNVTVKRAAPSSTAASATKKQKVAPDNSDSSDSSSSDADFETPSSGKGLAVVKATASSSSDEDELPTVPVSQKRLSVGQAKALMTSPPANKKQKKAAKTLVTSPTPLPAYVVVAQSSSSDSDSSDGDEDVAVSTPTIKKEATVPNRTPSSSKPAAKKAVVAAAVNGVYTSDDSSSDDDDTLGSPLADRIAKEQSQKADAATKPAAGKKAVASAAAVAKADDSSSSESSSDEEDKAGVAKQAQANKKAVSAKAAAKKPVAAAAAANDSDSSSSESTSDEDDKIAAAVKTNAAKEASSHKKSANMKKKLSLNKKPSHQKPVTASSPDKSKKPAPAKSLFPLFSPTKTVSSTSGDVTKDKPAKVVASSSPHKLASGDRAGLVASPGSGDPSTKKTALHNAGLSTPLKSSQSPQLKSKKKKQKARKSMGF